MNIFAYFREIVNTIVLDLTVKMQAKSSLDISKVKCEPPRAVYYGDLTTNAAMLVANTIGIQVYNLAEMIVIQLQVCPEIEELTVIDPGFINIRLNNDFWHERLREILCLGIAYGNTTLGRGYSVNVEFVSANPTGPLHVGHGRGAVIGDVLVSLLEKVGYTVTREYYINDAGKQADFLARSVYLRYCEVFGQDIGAVSTDYYSGCYLKPIGQMLAQCYGNRLLDTSESTWSRYVRTFSTHAIMKSIKSDLEALGIKHDVFFSEQTLVATRIVDAVVCLLAARGWIYEGILEPPKGRIDDSWESRLQVLFRATNSGDTVDRPLKKSDGDWTYFASDLAYHLSKYQRGFHNMINIWGFDHSGYIQRLQAAVEILTGVKGCLDVKLYQVVSLLENGRPVKMSKRTGAFILLREVVDRIGKDVVRFIMLTRKNDVRLDFDLASVTECSRDNPIFYVQYACARAFSVQRNAVTMYPGLDLSPRRLAQGPLHKLRDPIELSIIKLLAGWPRLVESAALTHEPHRLAYYLYELAAVFHGLWNKGNESKSDLRFLTENTELLHARLSLVQGVVTVIASGLTIFGISPAKEMR